MKIILTGATGYLGSYILRALLLAGHELVVFKRSTSNTIRIDDLLMKCEVVDVDAVDWPLKTKCFSGVEMLIHTATCYGRGGQTALDVFESNLHYSFQLLYAAVEFGVNRFVNIDTALPAKTNAYALSKKQFVAWGQYYTKQENIQFLNLVLEHFFGPGDDASKFVSYIIQQCLANVEIPLTAGEQIRDFLYIDDMVSAVIACLNYQQCEKFEEISLGSGSGISIRKMVEQIHAIIASQSKLLFGAIPYREQEVMCSVADIQKLQKIGWRARHTLTEALKKTIDRSR